MFLIRSKNYLKVTLSDLKVRFYKKSKSPFEQTKSTRIYQAWLKFHILVVHAPKFVQVQDLKARWMTDGVLQEDLENIYNLLNLNHGRFFEENKEHLLNTKDCKNILSLILGALLSKSRFAFCWTSACQTSPADFKSY